MVVLRINDTVNLTVWTVVVVFLGISGMEGPVVGPPVRLQGHKLKNLVPNTQTLSTEPHPSSLISYGG